MLFSTTLLAGLVLVVPPRITPGSTVTVRYSGAEPLARTMQIHYGFDGWNLPTTGPGAGRADDRGNVDHFVDRPMTRDAATGTWEAEVAVPQGARALHAVFCWDACGSGQWDNNGARDFSWSVVFPYIGPLLSWTERTPPATGIAVAFESSWAAPGWLEFWEEGKPPRRLVSPAGITHRFELTGLTPATRYQYKVGSAQDGVAFESATWSFRTTAAPEAEGGVSFVVFGDAQDNGENGIFHRLATEVATRHGDVDFVLSTGDMPWNDKPGDWWSFFDKGRALFATHAFLPASGNHDTPTVDSNRDHSSFVRYFALPGVSLDRIHYRLDVGPASFFAMNSERPDELAAPGGTQYRWLAGELERRGPWAFAYWHIPPFNAGDRHWGQQYDFRPVAKLFEGTLDWHFGGHEHLYQRFVPLRQESGRPVPRARYGRGADDGVGYLLVPSGGTVPSTRLVTYDAHPELRDILAYPVVDPGRTAAPATVGFTRVDIRGRELDLKVYEIAPGESAAAVVIDRVQYTKP